MYRIRIFNRKFTTANLSPINMSSTVSCNYFKLPVLYEDKHIIILNKPAGMMSVPGKEICDLVNSGRRNEQWNKTIKELLNGKFCSDPALYEIISGLIERSNSVPRKEERFQRYLSRVMKVKDKSLIFKLWQEISLLDDCLHRVKIEEIPHHLISASDVASHLSNCKIYHVHRLDMETSGIIMFAKSERSASELSKQFRDQEVDKIYIARVLGKLQPSLFSTFMSESISAVSQNMLTITAPMRPDFNNKPFQIVDFGPLGKQCKTECTISDLSSEQDIVYRSLFPEEHINYNIHDQTIGGRTNQYIIDKTDVNNEAVTVARAVLPNESTLVELKPWSGRTHQLRVHMSHIGHPILGDSLYPVINNNRTTNTTSSVAAGYTTDSCNNEINNIYSDHIDRRAIRVDKAYPRLCLHAMHLKFKHPITNEVMQISAPTASTIS